MIKKQFLTSLCITGLLTATVLSGCSSSSDANNSAASPSAAPTQVTESQRTNDNNADYSNTTVTAKVTSVNGSTITADIGTLSEMTKPGENSQNADDPSGQTPPSQNFSDPSGQTPPSQESNDSSGQTPPSQESNDSSGQTPPSKPDSNDGNTGSVPDANGNSGNGGSAPDANGGPGNGGSGNGGSAPDGNGGPGNGGPAPDGNGMPGGMQMFTETEGSITFTVTDSTKISTEGMGQTTQSSLSDITEDTILTVTFGDNNTVTSIVITPSMGGGSMAQGPGGNFGGSAEVTNGTSANTIDSDTTVTGETYTSVGDDENALRIDGATVTLDGITVGKTGGSSSNTENGDFYGQNAGLLALNGANVTITNANVNTTVQNGNGVFSYGTGTTVTISDSTINTTANNSGGIQTTGGGTMNATNLTVNTDGNSAAAIRSDRGGGDVNVTSGTYTSNGTGSPAIYSTADIEVSDAVLTANNSEAIVVEGKNSVALTNCTVTGNMNGTYNDSSENIHNVMIYQSMSGDAEVGHASFSMTGGSLTAKAGDMFYVTNTSCTITLSDVELALANENLLVVEGNSSSRGWGTQGANGGDAIFTASKQTMSGQITVDDISTLDFKMTDNTSYTGAINPDGQAGEVNVTMDTSSVWTLNGDSYVTTFDGTSANLNTNGFTLYVNGVAFN